MKKSVSFFLALVLCGLACFPAFAAETALGPDETTGELQLSYAVGPSYTVSIPGDVQVAFNALSTDFESVELTEARLEPGYAVQIALVSDGLLKHTEDASKTLAYSVNSADGAFQTAQYTTAGEATALTVDITSDAWHAAHAGDYTGTVTFEVSYVAVG